MDFNSSTAIVDIFVNAKERILQDGWMQNMNTNEIGMYCHTQTCAIGALSRAMEMEGEDDLKNLLYPDYSGNLSKKDASIIHPICKSISDVILLAAKNNPSSKEYYEKLGYVDEEKSKWYHIRAGWTFIIQYNNYTGITEEKILELFDECIIVAKTV